jgi:hypothetical protein
MEVKKKPKEEEIIKKEINKIEKEKTVNTNHLKIYLEKNNLLEMYKYIYEKTNSTKLLKFKDLREKDFDFENVDIYKLQKLIFLYRHLRLIIFFKKFFFKGNIFFLKKEKIINY